MKKLILSLSLVVAGVAWGIQGQPLYKMTEQELLKYVAGTKLDDRVTACQELAHRGSAACVPQLGALLNDATEAPLFHAVIYALENIPGAEVDKALAAAEVKTTGKRLEAVKHALAFRANPTLDGYAGADAAITAFPEKDGARRGDMAALPALIERALAPGHERINARRLVVGFPNAQVVDYLWKLAVGDDATKRRFALGVLGERRERSVLPRLLTLTGDAKDERVEGEAIKALAALCDARKDVSSLLSLLARKPACDELVNAIVRVAARDFVPETKQIEVVEAKYGNFASGRVADVKLMVDALVAAGSREIMAGNRLVGRGGFPHDPAPGMAKELRIVYSVAGGAVRSAKVPDLEMLVLGDYVLERSVGDALVGACLKAEKGAFRSALVKVLSALERRGRVIGSDKVFFRPLCNGKDLAGWSQQDGYFSLRDGVITGETTPQHLCKKNHHLVYTAEKFEDFDLRGSFRLSRSANSGIALRTRPLLVGDEGYQADMDGSGGIVGFIFHMKQYLVGERGAHVTLGPNGEKQLTRFADSKQLQGVYRPEQWNDIRVVVKGRSIAYWINGTLMASVADARLDYLPESGHISLQLHAGKPMKIEFRDLRVKTDDVQLELGQQADNSFEELALKAAFDDAKWIWHPAGQKDGAKVKFRAECELPAAMPAAATFAFTCDDSAVVSVNGKEIARQTNGKLWYTPTVTLGVKACNLKPGRNVIEIAAENNLGAAALLASLKAVYSDGRIVRFVTGGDAWKCALEGGEFVDAKSLFNYGEGIYGTFPHK